MIPESEWKWYGLPLHFICSDRCMFHLATKVGNYLVSSVGLMKHPDKDGFSPVGSSGYYETMVFRTEGTHGPCGCPKITGNEMDSRRFGFDDNDPWDGHAECEAYHREMCLKYATHPQEKDHD
jgi:hypothetical protein